MRLNRVYLADCGYIAAKLRDVDLIYADIIYDDLGRVPLGAFWEALRPGGALWLQTDYRSAAQARLRLDRAGFSLINWVIWPYNWGGRPRAAFGRKHDDLFYCAKPGPNRTFNAEATQLPKVTRIRSQKPTQTPTDVWSDIGNFHTAALERIKGPDGKNVRWQKPERLLERIVAVCSNPGDLVFEPYLGTGTACAVAKRLRRRWVGCDVSPHMVRLAERRLGLPEELVSP